ncbi:MAG: DUF547 domain-containing protein [bacterium]|nr:DUF547 domain-containing protein [bacterium]
MRRLIAATAALMCATAALRADAPAAPDVAPYDRVLQKYVLDDGRVRYGALAADLAPLEAFVRQMGEVSPHSHPGLFATREAKLAYWINAYNAFVLWAFARDYPEKRERLTGRLGRLSFFYRKKFLVGGQKRSLAHIENKIIRAEFDEPRIHFAVVCASAGCPWLARRAYTAKNLEEMLEAETKRFLQQPRNVKVDPEKTLVPLSQLLDWYEEDFGADTQAVLRFISRYRPDLAGQLRAGNWRVDYVDYDWRPNDAPGLRPSQPDLNR